MQTKNLKFKFTKEVDEKGFFSGHASVFGNMDLAKEIVDAGAFSRTLNHHQNWTKILWQHDWYYPIGGAKVEEDETGLKFDGQLILEDNPEAKKAYSLMKNTAQGKSVIDTMSIGYDVVSGYYDENNIRHLSELKLYEISPVTFAANPLARIDSVKGFQYLIDELKSGRVLSSNNRTLVQNAIEALQALLEAAGEVDDSDKSHSSISIDLTGLSHEYSEGSDDHSLEKELEKLLSEMQAELKR
jgi:HK97 family phage prohead protease